MPGQSVNFDFLFNFAAIEDDYKGPQLENGKVTLKFMEDLMEFYKQEKRLHKKFAYKVRMQTKQFPDLALDVEFRFSFSSLLRLDFM